MMKLLLLHGGAISLSRARLLKIKAEFEPFEVITFAKESNPKQVADSLAVMPLLSQQRLAILENPAEDLVFEIVDPATTLVYWFDHEVSEKKFLIQKVKRLGGEVFFFPEAKEYSVFPFLDNLVRKSTEAFVELNRLKRNGFDTQYLITMIFYLLRSLANPPKNAPEFVKKKLQRQKINFPQKEIESLYRFVLETDFKIKKGFLEPVQAEFLLINKFLQK